MAFQTVALGECLVGGGRQRILLPPPPPPPAVPQNIRVDCSRMTSDNYIGVDWGMSLGPLPTGYEVMIQGPGGWSFSDRVWGPAISQLRWVNNAPGSGSYTATITAIGGGSASGSANCLSPLTPPPPAAPAAAAPRNLRVTCTPNGPGLRIGVAWDPPTLGGPIGYRYSVVGPSLRGALFSAVGTFYGVVLGGIFLPPATSVSLTGSPPNPVPAPGVYSVTITAISSPAFGIRTISGSWECLAGGGSRLIPPPPPPVSIKPPIVISPTATGAAEIINLLPEYLIGIPELPLFPDQIYKTDSVSTQPVNF